LFVMWYLHIGDVPDALLPPFINATLFFAFLMLTDPPTSPAKDKDQIIFGILTAAVGSVVYGLFGGLMYFFIGLLVGNLYHFLKTRSALNASKQVRPVNNLRAKANS
jgi:Na+-translocating ferredoxin:NAD+ oxidoreductase RnfD subunit